MPAFEFLMTVYAQLWCVFLPIFLQAVCGYAFPGNGPPPVAAETERMMRSVGVSHTVFK